MPFSTLPEKDFFDRQHEMTLLVDRIVSAKRGFVRSAILSGPRGIGKTELLKQLFGYLFWKQDRVVPFYHTVNPARLSAASFSKTYLVQFLCHTFAFQKKEQALLHNEGMSIDDVSALAEDRAAFWAQEILDRYRRTSQDPIEALHVAISAPYRAALATGMPVAVLIDEFHRLRDLHIDGVADAKLADLFEEPMSSERTPHLITGNAAVIQEMTVAGGLERTSVGPFSQENSLLYVRALLGEQAVESSLPPPLLLRHLGGNPFYLGRIIGAAGENRNGEEKDYWQAYIHEVTEGTLSCSWSSVLKRFFPDLGARKAALGIIHAINHAAEPASSHRIARSLSLTEKEVAVAVQMLYLAGLIRGEFGVFRPVEDRVMRDVLECLYRRELLAQSQRDLEQHLRQEVLPQQQSSVRYDLTIPMIKEAELVAAQCIEQIGKNLHLHEDTIGQMQIAVIEACINAIEHGKGMDDTIAVTIVSERGRLEVSIEHAGPEFIVQETREPASERDAGKEPVRGWGIKLMKRFADEVRFERTVRGTKTVLIKKIGTPANAQKEDTTNRE